MSVLGINSAGGRGAGGSGSSVFQRAGTVISPTNAGDSYALGSGNVVQAGGNGIWTVVPSAGSAGINTAIIAADAAGGGIVQLLPGTYTFNSTINLNTISNVTIQGAGPGITILAVATNSMTGNQVFDFNSDNTADILNNTTAGQTTITTTTAGAAAVYTAGMQITIIGTDANGERTSEVVQAAAAGDGGTGIITLVAPVLRTMTSVIAEGLSNGYQLVLRDFTIRRASGTTMVTVLTTDHGYSQLIDNIYFEEFTNTGDIAMRVAGCASTRITNCHFVNINSYAINAVYSFNTEIENCYFNRCGIDTTSPTVHFNEASSDARIVNNQFLNSGYEALAIYASSSNSCSRFVIEKNLFSRSAGAAIDLIKALNIDISHNVFDNIVGAYCITSDSAPRRVNVVDNVFYNSKRAVNTSTWVDGVVANNSIRHMVNQAIVLQQSCVRVVINGNSIGNTGDASILVSDADNNVISNNTIHDCGAVAIDIADGDGTTISGNVTALSTSFGIRLDNNSTDNVVSGNNTNGDGIQMGTGANNISTGNVEGCTQVATRTVATSVSTNSADMVILVNTAAARTITLATSDVAEGRTITIKDSTGGALANNITIDTEGAQLIDGAASIAIALNYGSATVVSDGTNWFTV